MFEAPLGDLLDRSPYLLVVVLLMVGIYLLLAYRNFAKAVVGMFVFQTGIILFFILLSYQEGATVPIHFEDEREVPAMGNALPQALMLTAIVVGVATLGVALSIVRRIQDESGTVEDRRRGSNRP